MVYLKGILTLEAWEQLKDTGKNLVYCNNYHACFLYCIVEKKKQQWRCGACTTIKFEDMVMCDACQSWFHW